MENYIIKPLETEQEICGKGRVHYEAWQEAYRGLVNSEYLEAMTVEKCVEMAHRWTEKILVAKDGERVIGFVGCGAYRDDSLTGCGEIFAIYVLADYYGKGVGYSMMNAAFERLSDFGRVAVWVLKGNKRAIRFYERYGFRPDGAEKEITLGTPITELRMIYVKE